MLSKLSVLSELRSMLRETEKHVGLQDLTGAEMDVFLAAHAITGGQGEAVTSDEIRRHNLASSLSQSACHRALKSLVVKGLLEKAANYRTRHYVVRADLAGR